MLKQIGKLMIVVGLATLSFTSIAKPLVYSGPVLSGNLGDCPFTAPCSYKVTDIDVFYSGGNFTFKAESTGLCYEQVIIVTKNKSVAIADTMSGSDYSTGNIPVKAGDLLTATVYPVPANHVCFWSGTLDWSVNR